MSSKATDSMEQSTIQQIAKLRIKPREPKIPPLTAGSADSRFVNKNVKGKETLALPHSARTGATVLQPTQAVVQSARAPTGSIQQRETGNGNETWKKVRQDEIRFKSKIDFAQGSLFPSAVQTIRNEVGTGRRASKRGRDLKVMTTTQNENLMEKSHQATGSDEMKHVNVDGKTQALNITPRRPSERIVSTGGQISTPKRGSSMRSPRHSFHSLSELQNARRRSLQLTDEAKEEAITKQLEGLSQDIPLDKPDKAKRVLTGQEILQQCPELLADGEREEIKLYHHVYFIGTQASKLCRMGSHLFDDNRGDYLFSKGEHLHYRYEVLNLLGKGSFGQVLKCKDHKTGNTVAIKIIRNQEKFHKQARVELEILETVKVSLQTNYPNIPIVKLQESFKFRNHMCMIFPLHSLNMYELLKVNHFKGFPMLVIKRIAKQVSEALWLLSKSKIIHADLKPENILLEQEPVLQPAITVQSDYGETFPLMNGKIATSNVKVIDLGSSCFMGKEIFSYIQSRFYRAPEVILGLAYSKEIDMWSFGCTLAELCIGFPIFPGENEGDQLCCISEIFGLPPLKMIEKSSRASHFFTVSVDGEYSLKPSKNSRNMRRATNSKKLATVLGSEDLNFVDFVAKCLTLDPKERMTPKQALSHEFLKIIT